MNPKKMQLRYLAITSFNRSVPRLFPISNKMLQQAVVVVQKVITTLCWLQTYSVQNEPENLVEFKEIRKLWSSVFFGSKFTNYSFYTNGQSRYAKHADYIVCFHYILQTLSQVVSLQYLSLFQGSQLSCTLIGSIFRHSHERVVSVMTDLSQTFLGCLVSVKFLLESSLSSRYWFFEGERRNFEDAHACSPCTLHNNQPNVNVNRN